MYDVIGIALFGGALFILGILMHYVRSVFGIRTTYKLPYPADEGRFISELFCSKKDSFWFQFIPEYRLKQPGVREMVLDTRKTYLIVEFTKRGNYEYKLFRKVGKTVQLVDISAIDKKQYLQTNGFPIKGFPDYALLDSLFPEMRRRRGTSNGRNNQSGNRQRHHNPLTSP
jgi:hypothetical protein